MLRNHKIKIALFRADGSYDIIEELIEKKEVFSDINHNFKLTLIKLNGQYLHAYLNY